MSERPSNQNRPAPGARRGSKRRGQSLVELALVIPFLLLLLVGVVDSGLAITTWLRVNTAARDAARFALDAGTPADTASLVVAELSDQDTTQINIYIVNGKTDGSGTIPNSSPYWVVTHQYGGGPGAPTVQRTRIQSELVVAGSPTANQNVPFVLVEVDLQYQPLLTSLFTPSLSFPMGNYALIQAAH